MRMYRIAFVCIPLCTVWCTRDIFHWNRNCVISIESIEWLDSFTSKTVFFYCENFICSCLSPSRETNYNEYFWPGLIIDFCCYILHSSYFQNVLFFVFEEGCDRKKLNFKVYNLIFFTFVSKLMPQGLFFKSGLDHPFL